MEMARSEASCSDSLVIAFVFGKYAILVIRHEVLEETRYRASEAVSYAICWHVLFSQTCGVVRGPEYSLKASVFSARFR